MIYTAYISRRSIHEEPFMNIYNLEEINYSSEKDDWKRYEKNNLTVTLIFHMLKRRISWLQFRTQLKA